jgi:hypothetical protein
VSKHRGILICVLTVYILGLGWGYIRLPWAAIKSLRDYRTLIAPASVVSFDPGLDVSPVQRWYLDQALVESPVPVVPRLSVDVKWNAIVLARVYSRYYVSNTGAEGKDCLCFCLFGAWIPIYDFYAWMS